MGTRKVGVHAARNARLHKDSKSVLSIAVNGKTSRGDNGTLEDAPPRAQVKKTLRSAAVELNMVDGAPMVDLESPEPAPRSKRDGVITGLVVDRTLVVTGQAA